MAKPGDTGVVRIMKAAKYSMQGLKAGLRHEAAMRQDLLLAVALTIAAFFVADSALEFVLLTVMPWLVFTVEILNSAIEAAIDRMGDEYHELSGRAKDLGSAAVFMMLCLTGLTWIALLFF